MLGRGTSGVCLTWSSMNLTGLPINVQRRIALLLHQDTDARAPLSLSVSVPDPPGFDQAPAASPRPDASNDGSVQPWKLSGHDLGLQLHQQAAVVVRAALGHDKLQAKHCCSHKHVDKLPRDLCAQHGVATPFAGLQNRGRACVTASRQCWPGRGLAAANLEKLTGTCCKRISY